MKNQTYSSTFNFLAVVIMLGIFYCTPDAAKAQQITNTETSVEFDFPLQEGNVWTYRNYTTLGGCSHVIGCDLARWEVIQANSSSEKGQCGQIHAKIIRSTGIREITFELCMKDNVLTRFPGTAFGNMFADGDIDSEILADFNKFTCDDTGLCEAWPVRVYTNKVDTMMRRMQNMNHPNDELYDVYTFDTRDGVEQGGAWWGYDYDTHSYRNGVGYTTWGTTYGDAFGYPGLAGHYLDGVLTGDTTFIRTTSIEMPDELPREIQLSAYPNPFNPATTLNYEITEAGHTTVRVFDLHGRKVTTLIDQIQTSGAHQIAFDARSLSSGVYLVELQSAGLRTVQKITLMK